MRSIPSDNCREPQRSTKPTTRRRASQRPIRRPTTAAVAEPPPFLFEKIPVRSFALSFRLQGYRGLLASRIGGRSRQRPAHRRLAFHHRPGPPADRLARIKITAATDPPQPRTIEMDTFLMSPSEETETD